MNNKCGWSKTTSKLRNRFWELGGNNPCKWWYNKCHLPLKNQEVVVSTPDVWESVGGWENTTVTPTVVPTTASPCQPLLVGGLLDEARECMRDNDGSIHTTPDNGTELRSYKIRMYPAKDQKEKLQLWMDAADWSYDQAVRKLELGEFNPFISKDMVEMTAGIRNVCNIPEEQAKFIKVPSVTRTEAIRQAIKAKKKAMKDGVGLKLRCESKLRSRCAVMGKIDTSPIRCNVFNGVLPRGNQKTYFSVRIGDPNRKDSVAIGEVLLRDRAWIFTRLREESEAFKVVKGETRVSTGVLKNESLITYDRKVGIYHLVVRFDVPVRHRVIQPDTAKVVALDPGVRHFQMYYCPNGTHGELLKGGKQYLDNIGAKISSIQANMDREMNMRVSGGFGWERMSSIRWQRLRRNQRKKMRKLQRRLEGRRKNAHYHAANFLLSQYDVVIAPKLKTRQISEASDRKISKSTVRSMFGWGHYKFSQILKDKCQTQCGKYVRIGIEPGTSGTCGRCGEWNYGLGSAETFRCPTCNFLLDRDVNGARNNLLAELTHFIIHTT